MDGGNDVVELRQEIVGKIEFSAFEDVALGTSEEGAFGLFRIECANLFHLVEELFFGKTASLE